MISSLHRLPDVTLPPQSVVVWRARLERVANRIALDTIVKPDWPAPGLDDTQLGESSLPLELHRAQIPDRRVPSL